MPKSFSAKRPLLVDLALQGGGAHGAFTWGVLDRILEEPDLLIEGISGTSAGSMNAAVLAYGYVKDGREGARAALYEFWSRVAQAALYSPFQRSVWDILAGRWTMDYSPTFMTFEVASRLLSPYQLNPAMLNPLKNILEEVVDFSLLCQSKIKLFITATNVCTGRGRIFRNEEINANVLLASSCLPTLFQAVEIDGEAYWDGGYTGNPTITPLVQECLSSDTILVQINPVKRAGTPQSAREILNRLNEIAFNSPLMKELRMIALLRRVSISVMGECECKHWANMRIHRIASDQMVELGYSSKMNAEWGFLTLLKERGRACAEEFLQKHKGDLNRRSSFDLDQFL